MKKITTYAKLQIWQASSNCYYFNGTEAITNLKFQTYNDKEDYMLDDDE